MIDALFQGKRIDNNELIEGYLFKTKEHTYIAYAEQTDIDLFSGPRNVFVEVDPESVSRYTGVIDKANKLIFEGNTVRVCLNYFEEDTGTVIFKDGAFGVKFNRLFSRVHKHFMSLHSLIHFYEGVFEII